MKQTFWKYTSKFFTIVGFLALGLGIWLYVTYPKAPDVASGDLDESMAFMGSEEFNQMFEFHRRKYAMEIVDKLGEKSFDELVALVMSRNPVHREVARNIRNSEFRDEIEGAVFRVMLDKFYEQPEAKRNVYLTLAVTMESRAVSKRPSAFQIPSPDRLKKDLGQFMTRQSPATQGKTARLIGDIRKQRQIMGMPDPW